MCSCCVSCSNYASDSHMKPLSYRKFRDTANRATQSKTREGIMLVFYPELPQLQQECIMRTLPSRFATSCWLAIDMRKECIGAFSGSSCQQQEEEDIFEGGNDKRTHRDEDMYLQLPLQCRSRPFSCLRGHQRCAVQSGK